MIHAHPFLTCFALILAINIASPLWGFWRNWGIPLARDEDFE
jgi:hypothetical protein